MKNGDSASFKDSFFILSDAKKNPGNVQLPMVCGQVNGKNSFGANSGFMGFVCTGDLVFLEEDMGSVEFRKTYNMLCLGTKKKDVFR